MFKLDETNYVHRAWDSKMFGYLVADILLPTHLAALRDILTSLRFARYRLAYFMCPANDQDQNTAAIEAGGFLADVRCVLAMDPQLTIRSNAATTPQSYTIATAHRLSPDLVRLALASGTHSRFRTDTHFEKQVYVDMYTEWIRLSIAGENGQVVWTVRSGSKHVGLITYEPTHNGNGKIGLLAVDTKYRRMGIAQSLLNTVLAYQLSRGTGIITVTTQRQNTSAIQLYLKYGFQIDQETNVYHFWL